LLSSAPSPSELLVSVGDAGSGVPSDASVAPAGVGDATTAVVSTSPSFDSAGKEDANATVVAAAANATAGVQPTKEEEEEEDGDDIDGIDVDPA